MADMTLEIDKKGSNMIGSETDLDLNTMFTS